MTLSDRCRPRRVWLVLLACAALVLTACSAEDTGRGPSGPVLARAPSGYGAADATIQVLHFNVAGATENKGELEVIDKIVNQIARHRPDVISLNEICGYQNQYLSALIEPLGYNGNYARNNTTAIGCGMNWSGGVAVYVARAKGGSGRDFSVDNGNQIGQSTACISGRGKPSVLACSTHLSAIPGDAARAVRGLRTVLPRKAGNRPLVIAGDFNLTPAHPAMRQMYTHGRFYEVDMYGDKCGRTPAHAKRSPYGGACTWPQHKPAKKIDYIFVDRSHFTPHVEADARKPGVCTRGAGFWQTVSYVCSDHRQLWGTAHLRRIR